MTPRMDVPPDAKDMQLLMELFPDTPTGGD
jgi:hypothetical protein